MCSQPAGRNPNAMLILLHVKSHKHSIDLFSGWGEGDENYYDPGRWISKYVAGFTERK